MLSIPIEEETPEYRFQQIYQYTGCITAFSEAGDNQIIVPSIDGDSMIEREANDYSRRLVARQLLLTETGGDSIGGDTGQISCIPTKISFVPKVVIPDGKNRVILRASCYVDGHSVLGGATGYIDITIRRGENGLQNVANAIATELFLHSGIDLMRQYDVGNYFTYSPLSNMNEPLQEFNPISIYGRQSDAMVAEYLTPVKESSVLTLKVIDDLPADAVDFVKEQWGHDVSVYSCLSAYNRGK